jgi:hypothetical protein
LRTNHYNVPIAALLSLSPLANKSSTRLKALPMSLSVVPIAAERTKPIVPVAAATGHGIKSSDFYAHCSK